MRRHLLIAALLAGCGHAPPPAPRTFAPLPAPVCEQNERLRGHVRDDATGEPLMGATLVAQRPDGTSLAAVTDEQGGYCLAIDGAEASIDIYYMEQVVHRDEHLGGEGVHVAEDVLLHLDPAETLEID